jgi:hypothetical protein
VSELPHAPILLPPPDSLILGNQLSYQTLANPCKPLLIATIAQRCVQISVKVHVSFETYLLMYAHLLRSCIYPQSNFILHDSARHLRPKNQPKRACSVSMSLQPGQAQLEQLKVLLELRHFQFKTYSPCKHAATAPTSAAGIQAMRNHHI